MSAPRTIDFRKTRTEMTQLVLPTHTNNLGSAFGGQIAAWVDICGAVAAQRFNCGAVVTASMDQLHFLQPVHEGMVVVLQGQVNQAWQTSMEVGVRVEAENTRTGERTHCCSAYLTFVGLDEGGRPRQLPQLDSCGDGEAERRQEAAEMRRSRRLERREERKQEV
jgi:acyl-CoA hydrolase